MQAGRTARESANPPPPPPLLFYFDRDGPKKRKACGLRVGGTSLHVGTFPALADIRVAERKSERT